MSEKNDVKTENVKEEVVLEEELVEVKETFGTKILKGVKKYGMYALTTGIGFTGGLLLGLNLNKEDEYDSSEIIEVETEVVNSDEE